MSEVQTLSNLGVQPEFCKPMRLSCINIHFHQKGVAALTKRSAVLLKNKEGEGLGGMEWGRICRVILW